MRKKLVGGNWKMHGSRSMADGLVEEIANANPSSDIDVLIFPPYPYLAQVVSKFGDSGLGFGSQDISEHQNPGPHTGEVCAAMVADVGAQWTLVGHSERRHHHTESDEKVARKFAAARAAGLTPILCVGETLHQRESGKTMDVIAHQLGAVLTLSGVASFDTAVIAYEPVWAIGTGLTPTPDDVALVHAFIRERLIGRFGPEGGAVRILYGGSVKPANAGELLTIPHVNGALVGGASLKAEDFLGIAAVYE